MKKAALFYLLVFLCCITATAQNENATALVNRLEAAANHQAAINEINILLANNRTGYSAQEWLGIKTALVHKYIELQKWDSCLNFCQQQITAAHTNGNTLEEASFYKLIGNTYYSIPDKGKAQEYWRKTITIAEAHKHTLLLEQCYHNMAAVAIDSGTRWNEAEKYLLRSLQLGKENKQEGTTLYNQHNRLLATLYERINRLDKAEALYLDVISKSRELKDTLRLGESLMFYSDVLIKQKKFDKAIEVSAEAVEVAKRVKLLDLLPTALSFHSKNLYLAGRFKDAYDYKAMEAIENSQRFNKDFTTKITEAEAKFKNAETEYEKQLALVKQRKQNQLYILGLIGLFAVAGLLFYNFYQKRSTKQKVHMQQQLQAEKERLSRDLHDNLGSQMALLSNNIETLDANFKKQQEIGGNIEKVKGTSKQLLQTLREAIWILNKEQVTAQEFFDKLIDYAQRYLQSYSAVSLQTEEHFAENKTLSSIEALQLFRICQEAITNASKYSESSLLLLKGKTASNRFTVTIADTGKGFDINSAFTEGHYGLKNMQQRASSVNAVLQIDTAPGNGTAVTITV